MKRKENSNSKIDEQQRNRDDHHQKSSSSECALLECLPGRSISDVELVSEYWRIICVGPLLAGKGDIEWESSL